jgi:hypothetical protein
MTQATRAASIQPEISSQAAGSSKSIPVTWWKGIPARRNTFATSGTEHAWQ